MNPENEHFLWELRQIFLDAGFIFKILIGMGISLLLLPFLLNSLSSITENVNAPNLPFVYKIVTIGVVGSNPDFLTNLEKDTLVEIKYLDLATASSMVSSGQLDAYILLEGGKIELHGSKSQLSSLAEMRIRESIDKTIRPTSSESVKAIQKQSVEPFIRSIIAPFIIFSPLLLWCLPIIQSISYDRQNKMLEALFSLPISRRRILLSKVFANLAFAAISSAFWILILSFFGLTVSNPIFCIIILSAISLMIISLNALVSTVSSNVKNATLAAGITSTVVFSFLFILSLLRLNPFLASFASLSPVTYISYQVANTPSVFPFGALALLLLVSITAILLSLSAFSTEKFAFSQDPGISQLYEGMGELLANPIHSAIAMGVVAFSLTFPLQLLGLGIILFVSASQWSIILFVAATEEFLKFLAIKIIAPKDAVAGAKFGFFVGMGYGICEAILLFPFFPNIWMRFIPIIVHGIFSMCIGIGFGLKKPYVGFAIACLLHFTYNYILVSRFMP